MLRDIDALTSSTLKHLREQWWDDAFTGFLEETLRPKPGKRILDVGSGSGTAEASLARLRMSQVQLFGVDLIIDRIKTAKATISGMNARASYAAADACHLPFADESFDSTFCVAVLQHIRDVASALAEFARVTRPGGRIVAVEPDNMSVYWFSSAPAGNEAFELGRTFFAATAAARGDGGDPRLGPNLPGLFSTAGIDPVSMHLFPVSKTRLGAPPASVWDSRRRQVTTAIDAAGDDGVKRHGAAYLQKIDEYAAQAQSAGDAFVEIQNTMLFATVGQRTEAANG